jgi:hypothetical protein
MVFGFCCENITVKMTKSQNPNFKQIPMKTEMSKQTERQRGLEFDALFIGSCL